LKHNIERMSDDHDNAMRLASGLSGLNGISVDASAVQTNMVFMETDQGIADALCSYLATHDIYVKPATRMRLVTHMDVSRSDIDTVISTVREYFAN
jgi:threonine aldolase